MNDMIGFRVRHVYEMLSAQLGLGFSLGLV